MKSQNCIDTIATPGPSPTFGLPPWIRRGVRVVARWIERVRQRRNLAQLDDNLLADVGLTRADVRTETEKPFWRP